MAKEVHFVVHARLPKGLEVLETLAKNLFWSWNHDAIDLFRRIDADLWERVGHNPIRLLGEAAQERLEDLARDEAFLANMRRILEEQARYLEGLYCWYQQTGREGGPPGDGKEHPWVAYFSMEFGITECLPIYSGGLGMLAGDCLKSASDLGIPVVGVGILYQQGYFQQYLNSDGWQQEEYPDLDFHKIPVSPAVSPGNRGPVVISVPMEKREVQARVWEAALGRNRLILLDTNIEQNSPEDRRISFQLYGGDVENRIKQEILLGIGGCRAMEALNLAPSVFHMNEGHSAFLALERVRCLVEKTGLEPEDALEAVRATSVFTTHTPVPAGNDYFAPDLVLKYLGDYAQSIGFSPERFLGLGRIRPSDPSEQFCMTVLALRTSAHRNGVSRLHGQVSREMWKDIWPGLDTDDVPIGHVTNGVHPPTWVSKDMAALFDSYLNPAWKEDLPDPNMFQRIRSIPAPEIWRSHERRRERLVGFARQRLQQFYALRGASRSTVAGLAEVLDPGALTIGFARRFAEYKRADLLFKDPDRLARILGDPDRPVQIIFAGKAHPRDDRGKSIIQKILHYARERRFWSKVVFLENYDQDTARRMVQGVDVWLNLPRRPMEASGTSGMKAAFNGALHVSVMDGWWDEAWNPEIGWAVGRGEVYDTPEMQDQVEASALYDLLEGEVIPLFYERGRDGLPRRWVEMMKESMATLIPKFNASRMVRDYLVRFYKPAATLLEKLKKDRFQGARTLGAFRRKIQAAWDGVKVEDMVCATGDEPRVGDRVRVEVTLRLGEISPSEVAVTLVYGPMAPDGSFRKKEIAPLAPSGFSGPGLFTFSGDFVVDSTGSFGVKAYVTPDHPLLYDRLGWGFVH